MPIEAVVFDWGGVLAGGTDGSRAEIEQRLGVPAGSLSALLGMHPYETDTSNVWHMRELGLATSLDWARWYSARLTAAGGAPLMTPEAMVAAEADRFSLTPNAVMLDFVRRLRSEGYKLAICTNNFVEIDVVWRKGLPLDHFDAVVVSCEVGMRKPDAEMYDHVAERLHVEPAATLLLDDIAANVEGARRAGWQAILVDGDHAAAVGAAEAVLVASQGASDEATVAPPATTSAPDGSGVRSVRYGVDPSQSRGSSTAGTHAASGRWRCA